VANLVANGHAPQLHQRQLRARPAGAAKLRQQRIQQGQCMAMNGQRGETIGILGKAAGPNGW
jgi:hypothetical protein